MAAEFRALKSSVTSSLQKIEDVNQMPEADRVELARKLAMLQVELDTPSKTLQQLALSPNKLMITRIAIAMGIFDAFAANGNAHMDLEQLGAQTKGDRAFLTRVVRYLSVKGLLRSSGKGTWTPSSLGAMMVTGSPATSMVIHFYGHLKTQAGLLEYLQGNNFENPSDYYKSPSGYAYGTDKGWYDWVSKNDEQQSAFNHFMSIQQKFRGQDWFDFYPVDEKLKSYLAPADTLLVDVGGSFGLDAMDFRKKFAHLPGKVVLQDLPPVVKDIKGPFPPDFEIQEHDAFTAQPVRGARAYYLRTVLHDFPDSRALEILGHIHSAMADDSVLLLNENVMSEDEVSDFAADSDCIMMLVFASWERTEAQWLELLKKANFRVAKVWRPTTATMTPMALFEATKN